MEENKCGCKGVRTCFACSHDLRNSVKAKYYQPNQNTFVFCPFCHACHHLSRVLPDPTDGSNELVSQVCKIYSSSGSNSHCINKFGNPGKADTLPDIRVDGIAVKSSVISSDVEDEVVSQIETYHWKVSQSGRIKQDFGPKPNFKKRKLRLETFTGLPAFSEWLLPNLRKSLPGVLGDFEAVEQCHLDYNPSRGSHIDPHFDDFWLWGERLVTVNLLSDSIISLTNPNSPETVLIGQPRGSLVVLSKEARNVWLHGIFANHIIGRRIAITYRELTPEMKLTDIGQEVARIASNFTATQTSS